MVHGIHHVQLTVPPEKLAEAKAFYVDRLGFIEIDEPFGIEGFWLAAGAQQVHIRVEADVPRHLTRAHPAFVVNNLPAIHADLIACDCLIDPQSPFDGYERIHVIDPGGNRIELMQKTAPADQ